MKPHLIVRSTTTAISNAARFRWRKSVCKLFSANGVTQLSYYVAASQVCVCLHLSQLLSMPPYLAFSAFTLMLLLLLPLLTLLSAFFLWVWKTRAASHLLQCSFSQRCMRRAAAATRLHYTFAFDAHAHTLCRDLNAVLNSHSASLQLLAVAALAIAAALSLHLCRWRIVAWFGLFWSAHIFLLGDFSKFLHNCRRVLLHITILLDSLVTRFLLCLLFTVLWMPDDFVPH